MVHYSLASCQTHNLINCPFLLALALLRRAEIPANLICKSLKQICQLFWRALSVNLGDAPPTNISWQMCVCVRAKIVILLHVALIHDNV